MKKFEQHLALYTQKKQLYDEIKAFKKKIKDGNGMVLRS